MRKTKIICTLGPATDDINVLRELMLNGMDVARVNMSHQDHATHKGRVEAVRKLREQYSLPVALLMDTKGPEIRTGAFSTPNGIFGFTCCPSYVNRPLIPSILSRIDCLPGAPGFTSCSRRGVVFFVARVMN